MAKSAPERSSFGLGSVTARVQLLQLCLCLPLLLLHCTQATPFIFFLSDGLHLLPVEAAVHPLVAASHRQCMDRGYVAVVLQVMLSSATSGCEEG